MDKTILNLLFNYKGTITYREFRVGIIIVFISVGTYLSSMLISMLSATISARMGAEWLAANSVYTQITSSFTPNLVPVWFIVSYSSFVLALKRIRTLQQNRTMGIISGIINYLFFASIVVQIFLVGYETNLQRMNNYMQFITPVLIYTIHSLFLIGLVNLIYLSIRRETEQEPPAYIEGRLDIFGYCIKLGNLMAITAVVTTVIGIVMKISGHSLLYFSTTHQIIIGICSIVALIFYIKYAICRLKDANVSILWLVSVMGIYAILFGLKIWMNYNIQNSLTAYYNTLFAIATSFYVAMSYLLFLLPTDRKASTIEER